MMTGMIVSGLISLTPQILKTVESFSRASNPTSPSMKKYEFILARGQYDHICKKLNYLIKFLQLSIELPNVQLDEEETIDQNALIDFVKQAMIVLKEFDKYLADHVIPNFCADYFSMDIATETEIYTPIEKYQIRLANFDKNQLIASMMQKEMQEFDAYMPNYGIGVSNDRFTLIDKLLSDSILALSRVHPNRSISMLKEFIILPGSTPVWILDREIVESLHVREYENYKLAIDITWTEKVREKLAKYTSVYKFKVRVMMESMQSKQWYTEDYVENYLESSFSLHDCTIKVAIPVRYSTIQEHLRFYPSLIGEIDVLNLSTESVAKLHNLNPETFTFGALLTRGDYSLDDPILSINAIINNTIGSAQFSLQTGLSVCKAWQVSLLNCDTAHGNKIIYRYSNLFDGLDILNLSAIGSHIILRKTFQLKNTMDIATLWDRVIRDLEFTRKYIMRTSFGRHVIDKII